MKTTRNRKTKIVATIGPETDSPEVIRQLIEAGMDVARLNFSHGSHESHSRVLEILREQSREVGRHIAIFQDLSGPKVRIGEIQSGEIMLRAGSKIEIAKATGELGTLKRLFVDAFDPTKVVSIGDKLLLADGRVELIAEKIGKDAVNCIVRSGGALRSKAGLAVPDSRLSISALTKKDLEDVRWAVKNDLDYIALSFVGSPKDIFDLRKELQSHSSSLPIIAKFERASSLDHVEAIVGVSDAVMVARGDLGLELPLERVPNAQRLIIETANYGGTPVITATQMLVSMVNHSRPTRAEVSDVFTAVRDGTDAVMLSEETTIGQYPVQAVQVLDRIIQEAEDELDLERFRPRHKSSDREKVADAVCYAASSAASKIRAAAILACTNSGYTAQLMAKYRPRQTLFGATSEVKTLTRMALFWGVEPLHIEISDETSLEDEVIEALLSVRDQYGLKPGSRVIITAGLRAKQSGSTNVMEIREIPRNS